VHAILTCAILLFICLGLWLPSAFTRGIAVPGEEEQHYACKEYPECRDRPIPASKLRRNSVRTCRTHGYPMTFEVVRNRKDQDGSQGDDE
jgi:hypothetical protein